MRRAAVAHGLRPEQVLVGKDHNDIARRLRQELKKGDWLLVKGSRGMKMETVLHELKSGKA
jgi:UDP-N-acetylmuramyl pentapeptide synthase